MMLKMIPAITALLLLVFQGPLNAQQNFTAPDVSKLKHLTTQMSDHAPDVPGKETQMDFYSAPEGQIITVYTYKGRTVAFSVHSNSDVQKTYRLFIDPLGNHFFQEVNAGVQWQLPGWAR